MPGLLRGMARVAVVSGTATAASNRVNRRQSARWAAQDQAAPPAAAAPAAEGESRVDQLKALVRRIDFEFDPTKLRELDRAASTK